MLQQQLARARNVPYTTQSGLAPESREARDQKYIYLVSLSQPPNPLPAAVSVP